MADNKDIKLLHTWEIPFVKECEETSDETRNGQVVKVIRKVQKEIPVKMGLKKLTRREARDADVFFGKEFNRFVKMGFLPRSIMINEHLNLSGGILSEKERSEVGDLTQKSIELENDLVRMTGAKAAQEQIDKARKELLMVKSRLNDLNAANESVFTQTADVKAQSQLSLWLAFFLTMIERDGKWVPYFEGHGSNPDETFDKRQEFMWELEENEDEFFTKAIDKISFYVYMLSKGVSTSEQFDAIEKEMKDQLEAKQAELKKKAEEAAAKTPEKADSLTEDSEKRTVVLSDEQKELVKQNVTIPLNDLVKLVFKSETIPVRSAEGKAVKQYIVEHFGKDGQDSDPEAPAPVST